MQRVVLSSFSRARARARPERGIGRVKVHPSSTIPIRLECARRVKRSLTSAGNHGRLKSRHDMTVKLSRDSFVAASTLGTWPPRDEEGAKRRTGERTTPAIVVEHGQCFIRALSVHNITQLARTGPRAFKRSRAVRSHHRRRVEASLRSTIGPSGHRSAGITCDVGIMLFFMPYLSYR